MKSPLPALALLVAVGVAASGCGGDADPSSEASAPTTAASSSAPESSAPSTTESTESAGSTESTASPDLADEIHPTVQTFLEAWNDDDVEAFTGVFVDDGVLIDAGRRKEGVREIGDFAQVELMNYGVEVVEIVRGGAGRQVLLVDVSSGGSDGFRATFDFTFEGDRIVLADLRFA